MSLNLNDELTIALNVQDFPGLKVGLEGKGSFTFRVTNADSKKAYLLLDDVKVDKGNLADKRMDAMIGKQAEPEDLQDDEDIDDI